MKSRLSHSDSSPLPKVVLAELLPQLPVLAERGQCRGHLTQGDDVPPI